MKPIKYFVLGLMLVLIALPVQPAFAQQSVCGSTYVVQNGDSLREIAQMCGTTVQSILNLNPGISNPNLIYTGQVLNLQPGNNQGQVPIPSTGAVVPQTGAGRLNSPLYVVKPGDTFSYLASRLNTTEQALRSANPRVENESQLQVGQVLVKPGYENLLPAIAVSPRTGVPGSQVTLYGFGFDNNVDLQIGVGVPGQASTGLETVNTGSNGNFKVTVNVPTSFGLGQTLVFVADNPDTSNIEAISNLFYAVNPTNRAGALQYRIEPGDTLSYLANEFGVSIQDILNANPQVASSGTIIAGNYIVIPAPGQQGVPGTGGTPQQNQPSIAILPKNPNPGQRVFVLATGFPADTTVDVLMGAPGAPAAVADSVDTGAFGVVYTSLTVPQNPSTSQPWVVYVTTRDRSVSVVSQTFNVTGIPSTGGPSFPSSGPAAQLGNPVWVDNFNTGTNWLISNGAFTNASIDNGRMALTANTGADGWRITWPVVSNYYLQATEITGQCAPDDRYGLFVQVPVSRNAAQVGYLYGFTCSGQYFLREWNGGSGQYLIAPTASNSINTGANASNDIGIAVAPDGQMALYANGQLLAQVTDTTYTGQGRFGLFAGSPTNANFTVYVDQIAYWNLP